MPTREYVEIRNGGYYLAGTAHWPGCIDLRLPRRTVGGSHFRALRPGGPGL